MASIKEEEEIEDVIDDVCSRGDSISGIRGFRIYGPDSEIGECIRVRISRVRRNFAVAERIR
ncbi:MAG: deoxyribonuclease [Candidatus Bathyarchaeia archaeon]